ncbi:mannose-1-phosphate guanylyltransferase [Virgibacillus sp. 7505]|uniref:sugar phosphate nucleotidyltransferase n=1 Tax=Virgibacillus sp. 7505 TaxID=2022548 RepID=UPI000BA64654|nr:sugar phosphate nucleotidyltransferase [Virgibacillus sp. 7505]PAE18202.1 mannose-1-phosphate guanylyltransferase [Virgibacillus sp. 7505]
MKLVLLSGGSGKRLWPLSNDFRSKQFLKVLKDENNNRLSMVQRVWNQLRVNNLQSEAIITTSKSQVEILHSQLGSDINLVVEPERRDTFPAIALACSYLLSENVDLDETICVLPVDPFVEERFYSKLFELDEVVSNTNCDLALLGVEPTFPSEKYGYIVPQEVSKGSYMSVKSFKEKPDQHTAKQLIDESALWNCGVFSFKLGYIIEIMKNKNISIEYNELIESFENLESQSFDYEVVERARDIKVIPYNGYWKDLGTWNTLSEEIEDSISGLGIISDGVSNSKIINELNIPIAVLGADNILVAASPDGILVTDKESSPLIKKYVSNFNNKPMYVERRWGWYKILESKVDQDENNGVLIKLVNIEQGKNLSYHRHNERTENWTIIKGYGKMIIDGESFKVQPGDVVQVKPYRKHAFYAETNVEILEVQSGNIFNELDITRYETDWELIYKKYIVQELKVE